VKAAEGKPEEAGSAKLKISNPGRTGKRNFSATEGPKRQGELERGQSEEPEVKEDSG
jgi:hypothetical protein